MRTALLLAAMALSLAGCATLSEPERNVLRQHRVSPDLYAKMDHREALTLPNLIELAERRVPPPFVVNYLRSTYAAYHLTSDDVLILRKAGVSRQVIDYLLATPTLFAPAVDAWWYDDPYWWNDSPVFAPSHHHHHHRH